MKKGTILFTFAATVGLLTLSSIAGAKEFSTELSPPELALPVPQLVMPGDTFSFDIIVFNSTTETAA
jgi:hypothetical protein